MRYSMLVYLKNMCGTLEEAAQYLKTASEGETKDMVSQNGAEMIALMTNIVRQHQDSLESPAVLELLEELASVWEQADTDESLVGRLQEVRTILLQDMRYQVRAVFFAELGGKWDSLESVYNFMREDLRFDPVVVLTPVFREVEKENGKTEQEVIYEDYLTERGIPFLEYDQYNLDEDCPDLAFICNPYESTTLSQFWPEYIAERTRLVYLPYFLPSIVLDDYPQVLCQMPVYDCAWKVIGSNEKHSAYYCKHSHHGGVNMLVTGVPKTDPLIKLKKEGIPLPCGWEKLQGKKVVLWNTWFSIGSSSFVAFDKVFEWFQSHRDFVLLWRPHPLTEIVTKLYYTEKFPYYQNCIERVKAEPNMLVDENADTMAAFYYSDAQVSDHSSMMQQYLFMDKPLLWVQNLAADTTGEEFISTDWMEKTDTAEGILTFLEEISRGEDPLAERRRQILQGELRWADGYCGERVCEEVWKAMHTEDGLR